MDTGMTRAPSRRQRLAVLLLLAGTGAVATVASILVKSGAGPVRPAAGDPPAGTGVVVGASPRGRATATATPTPGVPTAPGIPAAPGVPIASDAPSPDAPAAPAARGVFYISGHVDGLLPGAAKTLPLTVTNPNGYAIQVLSVDSGVAEASSAGCPAGWLTVGDYEFSEGDVVLTAPAGGAVRVDVPVVLRDSLVDDQDGCRTTTFALTFAGTAREVAS